MFKHIWYISHLESCGLYLYCIKNLVDKFWYYVLPYIYTHLIIFMCYVFFQCILNIKNPINEYINWLIDW